MKSISGNKSGVVPVKGSNEGSGVVSNKNDGTVDAKGSEVGLNSGMVSKPVVNSGSSVVNGIVNKS